MAFCWFCCCLMSWRCLWCTRRTSSFSSALPIGIDVLEGRFRFWRHREFDVQSWSWSMHMLLLGGLRVASAAALSNRVSTKQASTTEPVHSPFDLSFQDLPKQIPVAPCHCCRHGLDLQSRRFGEG
ncbi:hypothetical protein C8J56DRAFT_512499 [Mycena floridula]|nr:hypothetical protein C8J56DRAFT_512499 [Mycena floridula]